MACKVLILLAVSAAALTAPPRGASVAPRRAAPLRAVGTASESRAIAGHIASECLAAKKAAGLTYDEIADKLGYTNTYTCQLLLGQSQLKEGAKAKLEKMLPTLSPEVFEKMMIPPMRGWDQEILKEPNVYRTYEALTHYGMAIKLLINEKFGDGIMSAIDFYMTVGSTTGKMGEKRVVITFNGKFLPFIEQLVEKNTAASPED